MKTIKYLLLALLILPLQLVISQDEPEIPTPPSPPEEETYWRVQDYLKLSEKQEQELLSKLNARLKASLEVIKKKDAEKYMDLLRESQYRNMHYAFGTKREKEMMERENKIFELEVVTQSLATKYAGSKESEKKSIRTDLAKSLGELFDLKEENRKMHMKQLQEELEKIKSQLEVRRKKKDDIINRRIQELLDEDDYLEWE